MSFSKLFSTPWHGRNVAVGLVVALAVSLTTDALAVDWNSAPIIQHKDYQAVGETGASAYGASAFPIRLRGVVLNNSEDWLNPTADRCTVSGYPWEWMGGESEFYIQAVDLDGTEWDPDTEAAFEDFGGTSSWLGQNYGNTKHYSVDYYSSVSLPYNYTDEAWYDELDRLQLYRPGTSLSDSQLVRTGDLVEVRANIGLSYKGKMNVNENHDNASKWDFEVVILEKGYGLPTATTLSLSDVKDEETNDDIFDATRATGGEHYQSTLVTFRNVKLLDGTGWGTNTDLTLVDATGCTLGIHLGLNDSFASSTAPTGWFNVTGILDQADDTYSGRHGYQLLAMNVADFVPVPEPGSIALLTVGAVFVWFGRTIRGRRSANG